MQKLITHLLITICSLTILYGQEKLPINPSTSEIKWSGEYTFYFGGHNGTINFKEGYFIKTDEKIMGGEFIIAMNSIVNLDIENAEGKNGLVAHLKNGDFFDVKKYPTAKLIITKTKYQDKNHLEIDADLTLKGITLPIRFQAEVNYEKLQMTTKFKIDRTRWGITYNSDMKDSIISDAIGFEVKLNL